jgi:predicted DCC family thiol-disulfide oxidoreductase YuxK
MKTPFRAKFLVALILISGLVYLIAATVFYSTFLDHMIAAMDPDKLNSLLNQLSRHRDTMPLSSNLARARILFSRFSLAVIVSDLVLAAVIGRRSMRRIIANFFASPTSPVNLAFFRIAVFGTTLTTLIFDSSATVWFSSFPHQLQSAPYGVGWLLPYIPISKSLVTTASNLLILACITGIIGLFARASSLLALLLALYVLGITQFYGKVSHDHVLIWFLTLLAASRCGDALSVDAILMARKRADRGIIDPPRDSISYALPLRFASVLLGFVYFFPGFWKFWNAGFGWALSDNLKYQMYSKWMEFGGWTPFFRLDWHPWLCKIVALETMVFEMTFVLLVFFPLLRRVAAFAGVIFHVGSLIFLRIFFWDLLILYVALFDVSGCLKKLGRRLFKRQLTVFYDGDCRVCRRAIAAIRTMDVLDCIMYVDARKDLSLGLTKLAGIDRSNLLQDIRAITDGREYRGVVAYRSMAIRSPILWPLVPVFFLPPAVGIANKVYRRVKHSRSCSLAEQKDSLYPNAVRNPNSDWKLVAAAGILLVAANVYTGMRNIVAGWPFASYPSFAYVANDEITSMEIVALAPDGEIIPTDTSPLKQAFAEQRLRGMLESLLRLQRPGENGDRLSGLWQIYVLKDPRLKRASTIRFYRATLCTIPEKQYLNPLRRELLLEIKL